MAGFNVFNPFFVTQQSYAAFSLCAFHHTHDDDTTCTSPLLRCPAYCTLIYVRAVLFPFMPFVYCIAITVP